MDPTLSYNKYEELIRIFVTSKPLLKGMKSQFWDLSNHNFRYSIFNRRIRKISMFIASIVDRIAIFYSRNPQDLQVFQMDDIWFYASLDNT